MAFDLSWIKQHPYATGTVVIVGGIVVFYLLSSGSGGTAASSSGGGSEADVLSADEALAQVQAGTSQVNAQENAQVQAANIQAQVQNEATQASVVINNTNTEAQLAATLYGAQTSLQANEYDTQAQLAESTNQYAFEQNTTAMQDAVLEDQINSGVIENANNNATAIAGAQIGATVSEDTAGLEANLAEAGLSDQYQLSSAQEASDNANAASAIQFVEGNAGVTTNSGEYGLEQSLLAATSGSTAPQSITAAQTAGATSIAAGNQSVINTIVKGVSSAGGSVLSGIFG